MNSVENKIQPTNAVGGNGGYRFLFPSLVALHIRKSEHTLGGESHLMNIAPLELQSSLNFSKMEKKE